MLTKNLGKALNRQFIDELKTAYVYLNLSARLEHFSVPGAAKWMRSLSNEELERAGQIYDFLTNNGFDVSFEKLDKPSVCKLSSPEDVFKAALKQENTASDRLKELSELAIAESDFPAFKLLNNFALGQVSVERRLLWYLDELQTNGSLENVNSFPDSYYWKT